METGTAHGSDDRSDDRVEDARVRIEVRRATEADIDLLARLAGDATVVRYVDRARRTGAEPFDVDAYRRGLVGDAAEQVAGLVPDSTTSVVVRDGVPVGRLRLVRRSGLIEIAGIQVHPDHQNRGTGTAVLGAVLAEARSLGARVELEVEPDNADALRLYRRLGFEPIGTAEDGSTRLVHHALQPRGEFLATLPRRRLAAGALIRDRDGRFCLVEPTYKQQWNLPGGTVEAGESPADGCRREVVEELGVALSLGPLLVLDTVAPSEPDDPHGALILAYDGGVCDPATIDRFRLPADELRSFRFVDLDEAATLLSAANLTRVRAAFEALRTGTVVELGSAR